MQNKQGAKSRTIKIVFTAKFSMRAVQTGEVVAQKLLKDYTFYLDREEMDEIENIAERENISLDAAFRYFFEQYFNKLSYTQFSIEQVKHQFPETAHLYFFVDVRLVGKINWVS